MSKQAEVTLKIPVISLKALSLEALLHPQFLSLQPKHSRHHKREMIRSRSLDERAYVIEMISSKHKCQQEAMRGTKSSLRTSLRKKKMPERELTGFTTKL